jgi:hypothetical protein
VENDLNHPKQKTCKPSGLQVFVFWVTYASGSSSKTGMLPVASPVAEAS